MDCLLIIEFIFLILRQFVLVRTHTKIYYILRLNKCKNIFFVHTISNFSAIIRVFLFYLPDFYFDRISIFTKTYPECYVRIGICTPFQAEVTCGTNIYERTGTRYVSYYFFKLHFSFQVTPATKARHYKDFITVV